MVRGFLASFIHPIDGAILRLIIEKVNENIGYVISHLHDSIQLHPNYYNDMLEAIVSVYSSDLLSDILERKVFSLLKLKLLEEDREEFDRLVNEFKINSYVDLKILKEKFDPKKMYLLEYNRHSTI